MIKFENIILRHANKALSLKIGLNKIKETARANSPLAES